MKFLLSVVFFVLFPFFKSGEDLNLYLPADLEVKLWAESPMLYNPTNMDVDIKGRIWVAEGVNYRKFKNDSTQFYHHSQGDRIVILEDVNQDGKADSSKVFAQDNDLVAPLGIAVLGNKVVVSCAPHLIVYTDTNGDDKADQKEILLTGFGSKDHDHSLHSTLAGPDGKFHFNVGNAGPHIVKDRSGKMLRSGSLYFGGSPASNANTPNLKSDDGRVWVGGLELSINPDGTGLKVLGHNFRNSYETYIDSYGDMWQNDNDDQVVTCRVSWMMETGNLGYFSNDGTRYWNADQRPGQDMWNAHWHQQDPDVLNAGDNSGAGSPTGVVRLEGDELGQKYRGMLLSGDAGRNVLFAYNPVKTGSGYNLKGKGGIFLSSNKKDDKGYVWNNTSFNEDKSKWFRPSDAVVGTDGALYVADWYDAVVGGHQMNDKAGYGRIYRITPKNKKLKNPKLSLSTIDDQIQAFRNSAVNVRYAAYLALLANGNQALPKVKNLLNDTNPFIQARAIWLLSKLGAQGKKEAEDLLRSTNMDHRIVAVRALKDLYSDDQKVELANRLVNDPNVFVR
ncbi:MAG: PVC-type heme-binding CxxCH protein, partial [Leadbetterella sp.]